MILVSGAAGNLGTRLVRALVEKGHRVRALVLPEDPGVARLEGVDCQVFAGDITALESLARAFDGVEMVYHLAAVILSPDPGAFARVNVEGTKNMLQGAMAAGVRHFVYVSSASVVYPKTTPYSRSKRICEWMVRGAGSLHATIVRPTLVYGAGLEGELRRFWESLDRYPVALFVGDGRARKNPVHIDDLVGGLVAIAGCEKAYGKTYNLCGGEEISIGELARLMLRAAGSGKPLIHLPASLCRVAAALLEALMKDPPLSWNAIAGVTQDANLDRSAAAADLGYRPIGVRQGFAGCFHRQPQDRRMET